jgi:hypothetical protein
MTNEALSTFGVGDWYYTLSIYSHRRCELHCDAACTVAVPGKMETEIAGSVTLAEAVFVGSATEAATTATVTLPAGAALGAL